MGVAPFMLRPRSMRRLRVATSAGRVALLVVAAVGVIATVRFTIAPPVARPLPAPTPERVDLAGEGFATLFARRYLTWDARDPDVHRAGLEQFTGRDMDPDVGLRPSPGTSQRVRWAQVVQSRSADHGQRVYTVATDSNRAGLVYLSVPVARTRSGALRLAAVPALVGAPATAPAAPDDERLADVHDDELARVCRRALTNYLAGSATNLMADLSSSALVALPGVALRLDALDALRWAPDRRSVVASLRAHDDQGTSYGLAYELDVVRADSRWEIAAIQTDPTT